MAWARRNPPLDTTPPEPDDIADRPITAADRAAMDMADMAAALDKAPALQPVLKALPYIIPAAFAMSVISWGAFMYFTYKRSKHYYG